MEFQSGNTFTMTFTPNGTFDYPKELYEIACDGALFRSEHYVENQYYGRPGLERETFPLQRDPLPEVGKQGGLAGYIEKRFALTANSSNAKDKYLTLWPNWGHEDMFDAFIDSVINDTPTPCNELDGYHATYLGQLAMKSVELDKALTVPLDKWDYYVEL